MPPRKIVYILGLGHSGSTVLSMLLTSTGKAVGLGPVWTVLREDPSKTKNRICSCGVSAPDCQFWAPIVRRLASLPVGMPEPELYQIVLDRAEHLYGPELTIIDSSKSANNLQILASDIAEVDLAVLHNMKDVRSFTISILDKRIRKGQQRRTPESVFLHWYRGNRTYYEVAEQVLKRPPVRVTYEALCLATEAVASKLEKSLGTQYIDPDATLDAGTNHIISGNGLRNRAAELAKRPAYDYRWLARSEWLRPYILLPMVRRYNEQCLREIVVIGPHRVVQWQC